MQDILATLLTLENLAMVLAIAYLLLAARESLWCWYCAFISSALYVWLTWQVRLYMDAALNVFYAAMAVWGWWQWQQGKSGGNMLAISVMSWRQHVLCAAAVVALSLLNGYVMQHYTDAAWPYVDSFISWSSVVTTFMVVRKVLENWLYWIVIDGIAVIVYFERGLYSTALLFAGYVIIVVFGYFKWRREYRATAGWLPAPAA
jgi:nicotinamide mononucleotide transporter